LVLDLDKNKGVNLVGKTLRINMIPKIVNEHYKTTIGYNGNNIDKLVIFTSGLENEKSNVKPIVELLKANFKNVDIKYSSLPSVFTAHLGTNYVAIAIKCK
jgi:fatty acid-binding protein DegV